MGVYTFQCHSCDGIWSGKQYCGDLEASAESTYDLQRKLVKQVKSYDSSGKVHSNSFSLISPSDAVFQVIVENETKSKSSDIKKITAAETVKINSCVKLFENLWSNESKDRNFAFSPFSIFAALGILASGSSGKTLKQILEFLNYENLEDHNRVTTCLIDGLIQTETGVNGEGPKLSFASGIWFANRYALNPVFKETVSASYKAEVESVNFRESEEVRSKVNEWVERKTNGLIKDILPENSIHNGTVIVAANALYFKGSWKPNQFDPELTMDKPFYLLSGKEIQVPSMSTWEEHLCISCYKDFKVLKLPYKPLEVAAGKNDDHNYIPRFSMYIVLPNARDGLGEVINKVTSAGFLGGYLPTKYVPVNKFMLPKFKILCNFQVPRVLMELGLELPFDGGKAELTEMLMGNEESICISEVIHECFIEVDEEGTEAAACTVMCGISVCDGDSEYSRGIDFVADHPFMFMIREVNSGVVLC